MRLRNVPRLAHVFSLSSFPHNSVKNSACQKAWRLSNIKFVPVLKAGTCGQILQGPTPRDPKGRKSESHVEIKNFFSPMLPQCRWLVSRKNKIIESTAKIKAHLSAQWGIHGHAKWPSGSREFQHHAGFKNILQTRFQIEFNTEADQATCLHWCVEKLVYESLNLTTWTNCLHAWFFVFRFFIMLRSILRLDSAKFLTAKLWSTNVIRLELKDLLFTHLSLDKSWFSSWQKW